MQVQAKYAKIAVSIPPFKLEALRGIYDKHLARTSAEVFEMIVTETNRYQKSLDRTEQLKMTEYKVDYLPQLLVEVIVPRELSDVIAKEFAEAAKTARKENIEVWVTSLDGVYVTPKREERTDPVHF